MFVLVIAFAYIIKTSFGCAAAAVAATFIPLISAVTWANATNQVNNYFNFITINTPNSNTSAFDGNEHFRNSSNIDSTFHFTGSFTDHAIQFKYDLNNGSRSGKTYKGTINDQSTEMILSSTDGLASLVLIKK